MNIIALFDNYTIFSTVRDLGPLPSGVSLGYPVIDDLGRCASVYTFSEDDVVYLESLNGVQTMDSFPSDWHITDDI